MTCARFNNVKRFRVGALAVVMLALMSSGHPSGTDSDAPQRRRFRRHERLHHVRCGDRAGRPQRDGLHARIVVQARRDSAPTTTTTGTGGLATVVPLVAKGRGEGENSNVDMNYFLGLNFNSTTGTYTLAADFEEAAGQTSVAGFNRPVTSSTAIALNTWYHAAAAYSSTTGEFNLYLNGAPVGTIHRSGRRPPTAVRQHSARVHRDCDYLGADSPPRRRASSMA